MSNAWRSLKRSLKRGPRKAQCSSPLRPTNDKNALKVEDAPYRDKSTSSFLQGSYGNDTNVRSDSDVDVVMKMQDIFYFWLP
jgi:hypothetical protein